MFGITNGASYVCQHLNSLGIVSVIVSCVLVYPSAEYYIQISTNNDYDFSNMFIQSITIKIFVFSFFMIIYVLGIYLFILVSETS